ncbi:MAG TPA: hypothetical protein VGQ71_09045 [Terriglobales bacterium]|nr:hypothetical protein [Terriglobales bacterium]
MLVRVALAAVVALPLVAQQPASSDRYLVLATARTKTLRAELDQAVAQGYSLVAGEPASDILILEKKPASAQRKYLVNDNLFSAIKKGDYKGYRILPWSLSQSEYELGAILESLQEGELQPEYKLSSTVFTRNLQKDLTEASASGYRAVAMTGLENQVALLEKSLAAGDTATSYQLLATKRISTIEKEIAEAASKGFKVIAATGAGHEMLVLMEKQGEGQGNRDYRVISTTRTSTFEKEINQAAATGYRIVPRTGAALRKGGLLTGGTYGYEQAIVMEKPPNTPSVRYLLVAAEREKTIQRELNATPGECNIATMFLSYQEVLILLACPAQ